MELVCAVGEQEMVAEYLRAEIDSPRFGAEVYRTLGELCLEEALLRRPDLTDERENVARAAVLGRYRGYGRDREMFASVPTDLTWYEAVLSRDDVGALRYVDYSYWNELTEGSSLVRDGARRIRAGETVFEVPNDRFVDLARDIGAGRADFGPLIAWGHSVDGPFELLEGHLRATALALAASEAPDRVRALIGLIAAPDDA